MASAGFQDRVFTFRIDGFLFHQDSGDRFEGNTEINILPVRDTSGTMGTGASKFPIFNAFILLWISANLINRTKGTKNKT